MILRQSFSFNEALLTTRFPSIPCFYGGLLFFRGRMCKLESVRYLSSL